MAIKKNEKLPTAKTVKAVKKGLANLIAKKDAKKPSAMGQSAKAHQKDLAKISGTVAGSKKVSEMKKKGIKESENKLSPSYSASKKAEKNTLKSFKKSK